MVNPDKDHDAFKALKDNPLLANELQKTRRHFLKNCPLGLAGMALAGSGFKTGMSSNPLQAASDLPPNPMLAKQPHYTGKAKRVIYIHLAGSPPNLDLFDYKPELSRFDGKDCPDMFLKGKTFAFTKGKPKLMGTPRQFKQHDNGMWFSDALPYMPSIANDLCMIKSMHTDQFNHAPAQLLLLTGHSRQGRPSMGSWATYGLGTVNQNLPGFVVLLSGGSQPSAGKNAWGAGFLPSVFQGVQCRSKGDPVLYVKDPKGMTRQMRRKSLDALRKLNELQARELGSPETLTRIAQYELAYRMQASVPEVMDISKEPKALLEKYGAVPGEARFGNNCLLARRLLEQGVRFVQLFDWGWDFHGTRPDTALGDGLTNKCERMDRGFTSLIEDLKARGMLDETLVILSGEFGRTPFQEGRTAGKHMGRDHYPDCYTTILAGGGIKGGYVHGASDDLGFKVAKDGVHVHDLQATILHTLGMNHEKLTYRFQGRDYRLTDVHGHVVKEVLI